MNALDALPKRLFDKIMFEPNSGCWLWTAGKTRGGYGSVWIGARSHRAHVAMYETMVGPIPAKLQIDHLCRTRLCVNPAHLEPVTQAENMRRGNGWSARNTRKTHCPQGHALTAENLVRHRLEATGYRECRICSKTNNETRSRVYRKAHRDEINARRRKLAALCRDALSYRALLQQWLQSFDPFAVVASERCFACGERRPSHLPACLVRRTTEAVA